MLKHDTPLPDMTDEALIEQYKDHPDPVIRELTSRLSDFITLLTDLAEHANQLNRRGVAQDAKLNAVARQFTS